jgi:hypothetical protein
MATKIIPLQPSTIETIDMAIYDLIDNGFNLHTTTNNGHKKVPVLWVSPERAYNSKDKDIRDSVGKLKLPLISFERTSFEKDATFKGDFQATDWPAKGGGRDYKKHPFAVSRRISQKSTRKFASSTSGQYNGQENYPVENKRVVYEDTYMPIPIWVKVNYSIILRTEYQQQMNDLMTPFITRPGQINSLFAEYNGHRYEVFIEGNLSQENNMSNLGEEERKFQTKVELKVLGYLLGDGVNEEAPQIVTKESIVEVKLVRERVIVGDKKPWESDDDGFRGF